MNYLSEHSLGTSFNRRREHRLVIPIKDKGTMSIDLKSSSERKFRYLFKWRIFYPQIRVVPRLLGVPAFYAGAFLRLWGEKL